MLEKSDWWRLNKRMLNKEKTSTEVIEWTYHCGGWVRAKLDSIESWSYQQCPNAKYARSLGDQLIYEQKKERM